ncbi:unnamed protein product [Gadus morhua 'NCC']
MMKNATHGRIVLLVSAGNYSKQYLTVSLGAGGPWRTRLHRHFEKWPWPRTTPVAVLSTGRHLFVEFTTDVHAHITWGGHRYEVLLYPGYTLEQGSARSYRVCSDARNAPVETRPRPALPR